MPAFAYVTYTGDGVTTTYAVPFTYIDQDDVHAYVNDVEVDIFGWPSDSTLTLAAAPAAAAELVIRRVTPIEEAVTVWEDPNILRAVDFNAAVQQLLYKHQEFSDSAGSEFAAQAAASAAAALASQAAALASELAAENDKMEAGASANDADISAIAAAASQAAALASQAAALASELAAQDDMMAAGASANDASNYAATAAAMAQGACFQAHKNGTDQGIAAGAYALATFTTEVFDIGGYYDAASSKWTPPAGKYRIQCRMMETTSSAIFIALSKNGSITHQSYHLGNLGVCELDVIIDVDGDDYLEIYIYAVTGPTPNFDGDANYVWFEGHRVYTP
jgi:hypothetical protein